jgi:hypothetical protein
MQAQNQLRQQAYTGDINAINQMVQMGMMNEHEGWTLRNQKKYSRGGGVGGAIGALAGGVLGPAAGVFGQGFGNWLGGQAGF